MAGWIVELRYPSPGGLRFDCETQLAGCGLLVEHGASELPSIGEPFVLLELYVDDEKLIAVGAELVELDELTIQLGLSAEACAAIEVRAQAQFSGVPADGGSSPLVEFRSPAEVAEAKQALAKDPHGELEKRVKLMSVGERMQVALHGGREERGILLRGERVPSVQAALVRNPKLSLDEAVQLARSAQLGGEAAEALAQHPSWSVSPQVALALVRNPKTPTPLAVRLVGTLTPNDLRVIAKQTGIRQPIQAAAKKRLVG